VSGLEQHTVTGPTAERGQTVSAAAGHRGR
jgi:hypothetical protein